MWQVCSKCADLYLPYFPCGSTIMSTQYTEYTVYCEPCCLVQISMTAEGGWEGGERGVGGTECWKVNRDHAFKYLFLCLKVTALNFNRVDAKKRIVDFINNLTLRIAPKE